MSKWTGEVIAAQDMLWGLVIILLAALMLVPPMTPPKPDAAADKAICLMAVDITWDAASTADIDMWVKTPKGKPIGFSSQSTEDGSLVKDDLGNLNDDSGTNSERTCVRILRDGEYIVNLDLFSANSSPPPAQVHIVVSIIDPAAATMEVIYEGDATLPAIKKEVTAVRFRLKEGRIAGQPNRIPSNFIPW